MKKENAAYIRELLQSDIRKCAKNIDYLDRRLKQGGEDFAKIGRSRINVAHRYYTALEALDELNAEYPPEVNDGD